jgi:Cys-tRNA(Pro) deacylase
MTIKTIIMEDERHRPLIVLMHGDREISTKELARFLKVKTIAPCKPEVANKHSGYLVGGSSPFGTHQPMPVYMEETILELPRIYINGGKRGFLVEMRPEKLLRVLHPTLVRVGIIAG